MSLQVKFPFGRGQGPLHTCVSCGFITKQRTMFDSHLETCTSSLALDSAERASPREQLPSPTVCRNYRCEKCGFASSKSLTFLRHRRLDHGENFSIYPCDLCEYASRHKSKAIRHRHLVHKDTPADPDFPREMDITESVADMELQMEEDERSPSSLGQSVYPGFDINEEDQYLQPDENQNTTPVKKPKLYQNVDVQDSHSPRTSPVDGPAYIADATENPYNYITSSPTEEGSPSYWCSLCMFTGAHKWKVATHIRTVHMTKTLFKCPQCEFVTKRKIEWCVHKTTHAEKTVYACEECSYRTTLKRNFERHQEHHEIQGPHSCMTCSYSASGEAAVQRHMAEYHPSPEKQDALDSIHLHANNTDTDNNNVSNKVDVFKLSNVRQKALEGMSSMVKAQAASTSTKPSALQSRSGVTRNVMKSKHLLQRPTGAPGEVQCNLCYLWFKNDTRLRIHMVSHSTNAPWQCPVCTLRYKRAADLNRHMRKKHGGKGQVTNKTQDVTAQEQPLDLCVRKSDEDQAAPTDQPLDLSMKSDSPSPPHIPLYRPQDMKCSHCSYIAKWPSDLRRHMLVHSIEKRFRCIYCNKKYKYQFDLNMHMRRTHRITAGRTRVSSAAAFGRVTEGATRQEAGSDLGPRVIGSIFSAVPSSLECSECGFTGKSVIELEKHQLGHLGPYQCLFCDVKYGTSTDTSAHLLADHRTEVEKYGELPELINLCYKPEDVERIPEDQAADDFIHKSEPSRNRNQRSSLTPESSAAQDMAEYAIPVNGKFQYKCPKCTFTFEYPSKLRNHMESHENLKRFLCQHCGRRSNWHSDIKKHTHRDHPDLPIAVLELDEFEARETLQEYLNTRQSVSPPKTIQRTTQLASSSQSINPTAASIEAGTNDEESEMQTEAFEELSEVQGLDDYARVMNLDSADMDLEVEEPAYKKPHSLLDSIPGGISSLNLPPATSNTLISTVAAGRFRRFKCSMCGKRSNWKWDIKKHARHQHPSAQVIELTEEEAKATFSEALQQTNKPKETENIDEEEDLENAGNTSKTDSKLRCRRYKCSGCGRRSNWRWDIKKHMMGCIPKAGLIVLTEAEALATYDEECTQRPRSRQVSPEKSFSSLYIDTSESTVRVCGPSPRVKKFKCSVCPYRSDYRSDITRHVKRKHRKAKGKILILGTDYAAATLPAYNDTWARKKFTFTPEKSEDMESAQARKMDDYYNNCVKVVEVDHDPDSEPEEESPGNRHDLSRTSPHDLSPDSKENIETPENDDPYNFDASDDVGILNDGGKSPHNRQWQCSQCSYKNTNKLAVIDHFKKHGRGRAFKCKVCGYLSDYRGSLYRHIKTTHKRRDYQNCISYMALQEVYENKPLTHSQSIPAPTKLSEKAPEAVYIVKMFQCKLCTNRTIHKHNLIRHIKEKHPEVDDPRTCVDVVQGTTNKIPASYNSWKVKTTDVNGQSTITDEGEEERLFRCEFCPYVTRKSTLLMMHKEYHQPQKGKDLKCEHCPYYVATNRRLSQHMLLHLTESEDVPMSPLRTPSHTGTPDSSIKSSGKARHFCEKCPYVSINRNDFIYHKQFHRPKPAAPFKCEFCPYWVSLKRLLTQHQKVHSPGYKLQYYPPHLIGTAEWRAAGNMPSSPCKSEGSTSSLESDDAVQTAHLKQEIIASRITTVPITPEKLKNPSLLDRADDNLMRGYVVDSEGLVISKKSYRKIHTCRFCPYSNIRSTNLRLHEKMHGRVGKTRELHGCHYCDYQVGNKGLLAHHIKVHSLQYQPGIDDINDVEPMDDEGEFLEPREKSSEDEEIKSDVNDSMVFPERQSIRAEFSSHLSIQQLPNDTEFYIKMDEETGAPVLERATLKKWCCDRCPYATIKRSQFERHIMLHGSRQRYPCEFCDYSVPGYHLLLQHKKLHLLPNPNLLSVQSVANLQHLPEMPADLAAAAARPQPTDEKHGIHDSMPFYENSDDFQEPKKLFHCDRCPYSNVRRDHLLSHLKFHMISSDLKCPYCDYSVSKVHLLNQHVKVHFSLPGSEMSSEPKRKKPSFLESLDQPEFFTALELKQKVKPKLDDKIISDDEASPMHHLEEIVDRLSEKMPDPREEVKKSQEKGTNAEEKTQKDDFSDRPTLVKTKDGDNADIVSTSATPETKDSSKAETASQLSSTDDEVRLLPEDSLPLIRHDTSQNNHVPNNSKTEPPSSNFTTIKDLRTFPSAKDRHESGNGASGVAMDGVTLGGDRGGQMIEDKKLCCRYCDRPFSASLKLHQHESQHLIGNLFS